MDTNSALLHDWHEPWTLTAPCCMIGISHGHQQRLACAVSVIKMRFKGDVKFFISLAVEKLL
jgi:hypothetical protein